MLLLYLSFWYILVWFSTDCYGLLRFGTDLFCVIALFVVLVHFGMVFHRLLWFITVWYIVVQVGTSNFLLQVGFCTFCYTLVRCVLVQICTVWYTVQCTVWNGILNHYLTE